MNRVRCTVAQALVRFLDRQSVELDGRESKLVRGVFGIFGHGNVTGLGEALENEAVDLPFFRANNEQGMVHAATAYAKQSGRLGIFACTSSIGPGATNMVTGAATATINRLPVLLLPGDVFADRQPDPAELQVVRGRGEPEIEIEHIVETGDRAAVERPTGGGPLDDEGNVLPRDGHTSGRLQCRGPWVIKRYFKADQDATDDELWFDTGDVAAMHPDGTIQITDRSP